MNIFKQTLGDIAGGRVLDVATQAGDFVRILAESLESYTEIVGIDISEQAIETAQSAFDQENTQFIQMDAEQMGLKDESFDTVSISASLHHLATIPPVLTEMKRVLRTGKACHQLGLLPDNPSRKALEDLADLVISRKS